jgi:hypothetical protein
MRASSSSSTAPSCHIDSDILNAENIHKMGDIALSFFASACGKNRGAFVLDPPDGQTYGWCVEHKLQNSSICEKMKSFPLLLKLRGVSLNLIPHFLFLFASASLPFST